jgi:hypothetical protein
MENQLPVEKENRRSYYSIVAKGDRRFETKEWRSRREVNKYLSEFDEDQIVAVFRGKLLQTESKKTVTIK